MGRFDQPHATTIEPAGNTVVTLVEILLDLCAFVSLFAIRLLRLVLHFMLGRALFTFYSGKMLGRRWSFKIHRGFSDLFDTREITTFVMRAVGYEGGLFQTKSPVQRQDNAGYVHARTRP